MFNSHKEKIIVQLNYITHFLFQADLKVFQYSVFFICILGQGINLGSLFLKLYHKDKSRKSHVNKYYQLSSHFLTEILYKKYIIS